MNYKLMFYDFEVFRYDWLVVLIDYTSKRKCIIHNDVERLRQVYEKCNKLGYIWVGYNSRNYDAPLLKSLLCGKNAYEVNDALINRGLKEHQILTKEQKEQYPLLNFDISDKFHSLKQFEGFMGQQIKESDIDFTIDHPLTKDELEQTIYYCTHDVEQTIEVFDAKHEEFDSQASLIEAFNLPLEDFNRTKAQLVAKILGAVKQKHDDEFDIIYPDTLILDKYRYVLEWFQDPKNHRVDKSLYTTIAGIPHVIGWGGIHGCIDNFQYKGKILCADVASLYPSIMIEYGLLSRNVKDPALYRQIRDTRLKLKKEKNPMQKPYKIVLNSTYGASGDEHNPLYDPRMCRCVCVTGQLLLLDLIEKIEPYCKLIQSNTDGVYVYFEDEANEPIVEQIMHDWEKRVRLSLEFDYASAIWQKDVNNYILVEEDGPKSKGAYVKKLSKVDYDLPILNKALNSYFISGTPIEDTINNCNDLIEFQKIVKIGGSYVHSMHGDVVLRERVLRVFASTRESDAGVFKVKDGGNPEKMAGTADKCFIYNENVIGVKVPDYLDKQYYIDEANKRLNDFLTGRGQSKVKNEIKGVDNEIKNEIELIGKEKPYPSFLDLLDDLPNLKCGYSQLDKLIKLGYLDCYGSAKALLIGIDVYKNFSKCKTIKLDKWAEMGYNIDMLEPYAGKLTEKTASQLNNSGIILAILRSMKMPKTTIVDKLKWQIELLGYVDGSDPKSDPNDWLVLDVKTTGYGTVYITSYNICYGAERTYRANKKFWTNHQLSKGDVIRVVLQEKNKMKKDENGEWVTLSETYQEMKVWKKHEEM